MIPGESIIRAHDEVDPGRSRPFTQRGHAGVRRRAHDGQGGLGIRIRRLRIVSRTRLQFCSDRHSVGSGHGRPRPKPAGSSLARPLTTPSTAHGRELVAVFGINALRR
jgi:hypothetical protein